MMSPFLAAILSSASKGGIDVKDQRFFTVFGRDQSRLSVRAQNAYAIVDGGASGLFIRGNGSHDYGGAYAPTFSIDVPIPYAEVGDTFIMHVMHRSALTIPSGWSLEATSAGTDPNGQSISVLSRVADGTEPATVNVAQAAEQRMIGQCVSIEGSVASVSVATGVVESGNTSSMTCGAISATKGIALIGFSWVITTAQYNGARGLIGQFTETMGTTFYRENRMGVLLLPGLPGLSYPSGVTAKHCQLDLDPESFSSDYTWSVTVIEAT